MKLRMFAIVTVSSVLVLTTLAVHGQRGRFGARGENSMSRLQEVLDLTDAQISSFESLMETRRPAEMDLVEEIREARGTLRTLTDQGGDATAIGNLTLEVHRLEQELETSREQLVGEFKNLLTTDQRERFEDLEELGGGRLLGPNGFGGRRGPGPRGGPRAGDGPRAPVGQ